MATVTLNQAEVSTLLRGPAGGVVTDLLRRGRLVRDEAVRRCPVDTGRLRSSIAVSLRIDGGIPVVVVGSNVSYAEMVERGTGIFGPRGQVIRPRTAQALRFQGRGGLTFRRSVRGMRPRPFLVPALKAALIDPPRSAA